MKIAVMTVEYKGALGYVAACGLDDEGRRFVGTDTKANPADAAHAALSAAIRKRADELHDSLKVSVNVTT